MRRSLTEANPAVRGRKEMGRAEDDGAIRYLVRLQRGLAAMVSRLLSLVSRRDIFCFVSRSSFISSEPAAWVKSVTNGNRVHTMSKGCDLRSHLLLCSVVNQPYRIGARLSRHVCAAGSMRSQWTGTILCRSYFAGHVEIEIDADR